LELSGGGAQRRRVDREAIEQRFARAGWELDDSFSEYLIIGHHNGDGLSILAYPEPQETEDPVFELIDHERNLTYGVQEILPPQQAAQILQEHGQPPEEE
jgi:hypothetical protein